MISGVNYFALHEGALAERFASNLCWAEGAHHREFMREATKLVETRMLFITIG